MTTVRIKTIPANPKADVLAGVLAAHVHAPVDLTYNYLAGHTVFSSTADLTQAADLYFGPHHQRWEYTT